MDILNAYLPSLFSVGVVVVGWKILFSNAKRIATRNETFSIIRDLTSNIDVIANDGCRLWYESRDIKKDWGMISPKLSVIRNDLEYLKSQRKVEVPLSCLIDLRRALSLHLDATENVDSIENKRKAISNIHEACQSFKYQVLKNFENCYPPSE